MNQTETFPLRYLIVLLPFMGLSSYLMFDIPFFINRVVGYGFCDTGGPCIHLFTGHEYLMFPLGLFAMFNWWALVVYMVYFYRKHPEALDKVSRKPETKE